MNINTVFVAIIFLALLYEFWIKKHIKLSISFREYNLHHSYYDRTPATHITFTKHINSDSLRKAIYEAVYQYRSEALVFENFPPYNFPSDTFDPFFFTSIDFSRVKYIDHRYSNLDTISGALPCSNLILPLNIDYFWFCSHCSNLVTLAIPSPKVIHASLEPACGCNERVPIKVHSGFAILVPSNLLEAYRTDEKWSSLQFIDENGEDLHPAFLPYYK